MAERSPTEKYPVTLQLSPDIARRLMLAAEAQKRPAADVVVDLLDRFLPRADSGKKGVIPYS